MTRTERKQDTITFHLIAILKIMYRNLKKWFVNGSNALQHMFDEIKRKRESKRDVKDLERLKRRGVIHD